MKKTAQQPTVQPAPQPAPAYQAPRVQNLGAWQAVTLINSVPFNGVAGLPHLPGNNSNF